MSECAATDLRDPNAAHCFPGDIRGRQRLALRRMLGEVRAQALKPPPALTLDEWADRYRYLPPESASEPGRWRTSRIEVARGPMRAVTAPGVREITVVAGTQIAKTELLLNTTFYFVHLDPCPILLIQPSEHMANEFSKQRLAASIRCSPALRRVFSKAKDDQDDKGPSKGKDSSNTLLSKTFPGGHLAIASASSPSQLASRPIRIVIADEIDRYEASAGGEGDPLGIAEKRTGNFTSNSLKIRVSSPTDAPSGDNPGSRIYASYRSSDQRKPFIPCPHCGEMQVLDMGSKDSPGGIKWPSGRPQEAAYHCGHCGCAWTEGERLGALRLVEWRQTSPFKCCGPDEQEPVAWRWDAAQHCGLALCPTCGSTPVPVRHAGFLMSRLYSPFQALNEVALEFVEVTRSKNHHRLKQFLNTVLCQLWEEPAEAMTGTDMVARRESYPAEVPDGVIALFAGVDTQDGRLEITILGMGRDEEMWVVDHHVIFGDTGEPEIWLSLDEHLKRTWTRRDGVRFAIQATAVDSGGHRTQQVYEFCRSRVQRRIWAIRGKPEGGGRRSPIWPTKPVLRSKNRVPLYEIGTASAKFMVRACLGIKAPGPRFMHFPESCGPDYFEQLTSERLVTRFQGGVSYQVWLCPDGKRNEALDCMVYALAAYHGMLQAGFRLMSHVVPMGQPAPVIDLPQASDATPEETASSPDDAPKAPVAAPAPRPSRVSPPRKGAWLSQPTTKWLSAR